MVYMYSFLSAERRGLKSHCVVHVHLPVYPQDNLKKKRLALLVSSSEVYTVYIHMYVLCCMIEPFQTGHSRNQPPHSQ